MSELLKLAAIARAAGEPLPAEVSANGQEVWDWATRFSESVHRLAKMHELSSEIARVRCGNCQHWMKSRDCPRERHDNAKGHSCGPSMNDITCGKFEEEPTSAALRQERRDELAALRARASQEGSS